jgi:hypothetical protein
LLSQDRYQGARQRFALFIQNVSGDDAAARELDVDVDCLLAVREFDGRASAR